MITLITQPSFLHSSGNTNYWSFSSDMLFAPRFNLKVDIKNQVGTLYNTVLIPTNPSQLNIFDAKNIMRDFTLPDFNPFITSATSSTCIKQYKLETSETFEGLYIHVTASTNHIGNVDVLNNTTLTSIVVPASLEDLGFVGGSVVTNISDIYVTRYATSSTTGYINAFTFSSNISFYEGPTASVGSSYGYVILEQYNVFSTGATLSTGTKYAIQSNIDYLDYNSSDNYLGYKMLGPTSKFLTKSPRTLDIQSGEYSTLSFIQTTTQSIGYLSVVDSLGGTYSQPINVGTASIRIDIPTGTLNLGINANAQWYDITLKSGATGSILSETFRYELHCLNTQWTPFRLCWLNSYGGIDYKTFKYIDKNAKNIERSNFDRNLTFGYTNQDRGITTYRLNDFNEYTVVSDLVTEDEGEWLVDLFTSPEVYWIRGTELIPLTLTSNSYAQAVGLESVQVNVSFRLSRTNRK